MNLTRSRNHSRSAIIGRNIYILATESDICQRHIKNLSQSPSVLVVYYLGRQGGCIAKYSWTAKLIEGIDNNNVLKRDLQRKLACVYDSTSIANYIDNTANAANVEALVEAIKRKKQVVLRQYESAHSDGAKDRLVEPIEFTANMIDVWAYDVDVQENRMFKVARIHEVEVTDADWAFKGKHKVARPDVFRMTGHLREEVVLQLDTRAKSLLLEEFPLAERDLRREDGKWVLRTVVHSHEGVGRFVIGLAADVKILEGEGLKGYVKAYEKKYIQKI